MADGLKWRVNRAVRQSTLLPAPARHIMLTLAERAKSDTAAIPPEFSPSTAELVAETGQKETTVKKYRGFLEVHGWLKVERPTGVDKARHVPSTYQLAFGVDCDGVDCEHSRKPAEGRETTLETGSRGSADNPRRGSRADSRNDSEGRQTTLARVAKRLSRGSGDDPLPITTDRDHQNHQVHGADAPGTDGPTDPSDALFDAPPKTETEGQRVNRLARTYTDRVPLSNFNAVAGVVKKAVRAADDEGRPLYADAQIERGLAQLIETGWSVTANTLRTAIEGAPRPTVAANGHQPYRNPTEPNAYDSYREWLG